MLAQILLLAALEIPFRYTPGQIEVQVSLNGRPPIWCVVDSGSDFSILDQETAAALKVDGKRVTWTIGPLTMRNQSMRLWALDNFRRQKREIRGLIGHELFDRYVVTIDFQKRVLILHEPAEFRAPPKALRLPITFDGHLPVVSAKLKFGEKTLTPRLMVDTGASTAVVLRHPYATENHLVGESKMSDTLALGVTPFVKLAATELIFGGRTFPNPKVEAYGSPRGAGGARTTDGVLGNSALQNFRVTFDYSRKRILLE
ncbi:MAG TPA: hypothetical protein VKB93_06600 [Thermoanaerobaculia bacterium]|nr:hypothetical protein [Thermoanaerobaculia bacterium]